MKRTILTITILIAANLSGNSQLRNESEFNTGFWLQNTTIKITNGFIEDKNAIKIMPHNISITDNKFRFDVYGPVTSVRISESASGSFRQGNYGGLITDTIAGREDFFHIADLEVRTMATSAAFSNWMSVSKLPVAAGSTPENPPLRFGIYTIVDQALQVGDSLIVEVRSTSKPVKFSIVLIRKPISRFPYLGVTIEDSGKLTAVDFTKRMMRVDQQKLTDTRFYRYWPGKGTEIRNKPRPVNSRMTLVFREPENTAEAKPFEFQYSSDLKQDSSWTPSGNVIMTPTLTPGKNILRVRYSDAPDYVNEYSFVVPEKWFQTTVFNIAIVLISFLLLLGIVSLYYLRLLKHKSEKRKLEMQVIYSQLNPHFIFNAMSSIQGLMNNNEHEKANLYMNDFSALLRSTLRSDNKESVPLKLELDALEKYLRLEQLRFGFDYLVTIPGRLKNSEVQVPPMLIQPVLENAVKHGVASAGKGKIDVRVVVEQDDLYFRISDNGGGYNPVTNPDGIGLQLTRSRIAMLNRTAKHRKIILTHQRYGDETVFSFRYQNWLKND